LPVDDSEEFLGNFWTIPGSVVYRQGLATLRGSAPGVGANFVRVLESLLSAALRRPWAAAGDFWVSLGDLWVSLDDLWVTLGDFWATLEISG
jgi:hypothetical protein